MNVLISVEVFVITIFNGNHIISNQFPQKCSLDGINFIELTCC